MGAAEGKRAVVTGAASGIGQAVVMRLLAEGASVVAVDINEAGLAPVVAAGAEACVASVADEAGRAIIAAAAGAEIDHLVNAAGILFVRSIWDVTLEEWRRLYAVNVEGTFFLCQALGQRIRSGGAIVNLSSSSAKLSTTVEVTPYSSSKATILGITRSFAYVLAPRNVRVNAICPGIIDTPMQDTFLALNAPLRGITPEQLNADRLAATPMKRAGTSDEAAEVILFLLSPRSSYLTGQVINVAGGFVTW